MKLYFASGNLHKKMEMESLLEGIVGLTLPKDEGIEFDPDENGSFGRPSAEKQGRSS